MEKIGGVLTQIVDLILVVIIILGVYTGLKKGLIGAIAGLVGNIIGFYVAYNYYWLLVAVADNTFKLKKSLQLFFKEHLTLPQALMGIPLDGPKSLLPGFNLPPLIKTELTEFMQSLGSGLSSDAVLGDVIYRFLATALLNIVAFIIIWYVVALTIQLLVHLYQKVAQHSVLGILDKLGGLVIGAILSVLSLSITVGLLNPFIQMTALSEVAFFNVMAEYFNTSIIVSNLLQIFHYLTGKITAFWL